MTTPIGYSAPVVYRRNIRAGVKHPLDGMPLEQVGQLISIVEKPVISWMDHFTGYAGPLAEGSAGGYTLVGTVGTATLAYSAVDFGILALRTGSTEDDNFVFRLDAMTVNYATNRTIVAACGLTLSDVDDMEFFAGLTVSNADFVAGLPAAGVFFEKAETATKLDFHVRESGTSTEQTALNSTLVDATSVILAIRIENGNVTPYVHQVSTGWVVGTTRLAADANMPLTTDDLLFQICCETGAAAAKGVDLDWIFCAKAGA